MFEAQRLFRRSGSPSPSRKYFSEDQETSVGRSIIFQKIRKSKCQSQILFLKIRKPEAEAPMFFWRSGSLYLRLKNVTEDIETWVWVSNIFLENGQPVCRTQKFFEDREAWFWGSNLFLKIRKFNSEPQTLFWRSRSLCLKIGKPLYESQIFFCLCIWGRYSYVDELQRMQRSLLVRVSPFTRVHFLNGVIFQGYKL